MLGVGQPIRVLKLNLAGEVTWQYEGHLLRREENAVVLEALFNHPDLPFLDVVLKQNDRFVETFYTDRWYNVFSIYDRDDGNFKGWYCNVGRPAIMENGTVSYVDLALDLWISATGEQTVLDWDEFEALNLSSVERATALAALSRLQELFKSQRPPQ
jgi:predicted RNA-binding protein associated with RNAse of E/G family